MHLKVSSRQSDANNPDVILIKELLENHPQLREISLLNPLNPGYSGCRVYLALATLGTVAPNPWIIKIGPASEIKAEDEGYTVAKSFVPPQNIVQRVAVYSNGQDALILYDFAGFSGRSPIDLDAVVKRIEASEAVKRVVECVSVWTQEVEWRTINIGETLKDWAATKLDHLPATILETRDSRVLNSPDFGESFSNPLFYLEHGIKRHERLVPFSFAHGDLNLHNVLFNIPVANRPDINNPLFIDFRHANSSQIAVTDFAKLEACLRYQLLGKIDSIERLSQVVTFLGASRNEIQIRNPPEELSDKQLQELWRCISHVRSGVSKLFARREEAEVSYWATLLAYGVSTASYAQLSLEVRNLAYLDAAAIFTRQLVPRDLAASQKILRTHDVISPPVFLEEEDQIENSYLPILARFLERRHGVLVIGASYGKASGFEQFAQFAQRVYSDLLSEPSPTLPPDTLLEIISKRKPRHEIAQSIAGRVARWRAAHERQDIAGIPWAGVFNWHLHDDPFRALLEAQLQRPILRLETSDAVVSHFDEVRGGALPYVPLHGDVASAPDLLVLTPSDQKARRAVVNLVAHALEQRQHPLSLVFWRCEDIAVGELSQFRSDFVEELSVPVDSFFLSDQDDRARDQALRSLDIHRVRGTLRELKAEVRLEGRPPSSYSATLWQKDSELFSLPDIGRLSRGLIESFDKAQVISPVPPSSTPAEFLLGAPPSVDDIVSGRVVRREVLDKEILPAIRSALGERDRQFRAILIGGRAGAGVTTLLCLAAHHISEQQWTPVFVTLRATGRRPDEWKDAGELLAEASRVTKRPVILFIDAADAGWREIEALAGKVIESGGEVIPVIGGRRETLRLLAAELSSQFSHRIEVADSLSGPEWASLARVLQQNGFSAGKPIQGLIAQLESVGHLLPAIYQATDRMNRKFREIVAYEYHRYDSDALVQRAYRMVCYLGAFGLQITQVWLLKALGNQSFADSAHILSLLSDDIVIYGEGTESGEVAISPRHRLIAEEVLNIAVPEPLHRLIDLRQIISTANMASSSEGSRVARLLSHKGPLISWIQEIYKQEKSVQYTEIATLYEAALNNKPLHKGVEMTLRQHFALTLRYYGLLDEALEQILKANALEADNPATIHITGLIHMGRALESWGSYIRSPDRNSHSLGLALSSEADSLDFFRKARVRQPSEEYGYDSEARYFNRKARIFKDADKSGLADLKREAGLQALSALSLIKSAEELIPQEKLVEIPKTKAFLFQAIGSVDQAQKVLSDEIEKSKDPVRTMRLMRSAATLAAEGGDWKQVIALSKDLIRRGERDASMYLLLDRALAARETDVRERLRWIRESVQQWNRGDVETLARFAELSLYVDDWQSAIEALEKADEIAKERTAILNREKIRDVLREPTPYSTIRRRFSGQILRLMKPFEGLVSLPVGLTGIFFRTGQDVSHKISVGTRVSYSIALRIRGLRAVDLQIASEN